MAGAPGELRRHSPTSLHRANLSRQPGAREKSNGMEFATMARSFALAGTRVSATSSAGGARRSLALRRARRFASSNALSRRCSLASLAVVRAPRADGKRTLVDPESRHTDVCVHVFGGGGRESVARGAGARRNP